MGQRVFLGADGIRFEPLDGYQPPRQANGRVVNAFTVDVEEEFHATNLRVPPRDWEHLPSRVERNTYQLLELLAEQGVQGTFFVLGWVAERHPRLVRDIRAAGHEVGSHGYWHRLIYEQSPGEFREDVRRARAVLEDILGERVWMYRAPTFSVTRRNLWALECLAEEGYRLDSSIFPAVHDRYGIADAPLEPYRVRTRSGELLEVPLTPVCIGRLRLPFGGGGYFRALPWGVFRALMSWLNACGRPVVFYIHPWELAPGEFNGNGSRFVRLRHDCGRAACWTRLAALLRSFRFATMGQLAARYMLRVS